MAPGKAQFTRRRQPMKGGKAYLLGGCTLIRPLTIALLAVLFAFLVQFSGSPPQALASEPAMATAQADAEPNPYAGSDGASPLDNVPVLPMVGGTVGLLGTLCVVAIRREWI